MNEGREIDVRIANGTAEREDGGVPRGDLLRRYAIAILDPEADVEAARAETVAAIGAEATAQAASIVASFDGINRVADATGIRLDPEVEARGASQIVGALALESLGAARGAS